MNSKELFEWIERERKARGWSRYQFSILAGHYRQAWSNVAFKSKREGIFKSLDNINRYLKPLGKCLGVVDIDGLKQDEGSPNSGSCGTLGGRDKTSLEGGKQLRGVSEKGGCKQGEGQSVVSGGESERSVRTGGSRLQRRRSTKDDGSTDERRLR